MRIMSTWRSKVRVLLSEIFIRLANNFNKFLITGLKIILNKTLDMHLYSMYSLDTLDTLDTLLYTFLVLGYTLFLPLQLP